MNWHTGRFDLEAGRIYRIWVRVAGTALGVVDVRIVAAGKVREHRTGPGDVTVLKGRTVPIKFRIEEGAVFVVTPEGREISAIDNRVRMVVPEGTVSVPVGVTVQPASGFPEDPKLVGGTIFDIGPDGVAFQKRVEFTVTYDPEKVPEGVLESSLRLHKVVNGTWQMIESTVDLGSKSVAALLDGFSVFGIRGGPSAITGVTWDCGGLVRDAVGSDLWPITWSDDGHQYTAWGDGDGFQVDAKHGYGIARIEGQPIGYVATDLFQAPGGAVGKVSGMISLGGVLYMWRFDQLAAPNDKQHTLIKSSDKGVSVTPTAVQFPRSDAPSMVPNTFVNQGRDNADAIDGFVYSTAADWLTADPVYLLRVPVDRIEEPAAYEVFSGTAASPAWSTDFTQRRPIYSDPTATTFNGAAHTVITYFAPRQRFILTAHHADDMGKWSIHQGPKPWGPWTELTRYSDWCGFGEGLAEVLPRYMAPKWTSADGTEFWMVFSGTQVWDRFNAIRGTFQLQ